MDLSKEELSGLRSLKSAVDSDDIRWKEVVKQKLLKNNKIIYVLNNKELESKGAEPDDYFGVNILPYYLIHPTQHSSKNFLCYETAFTEMPRYNDVIKYQDLIFWVLCEQETIIEKSTYTARHDLLSALILDEFNYTNYFGMQIHCIFNEASTVDTDYACRKIIFRGEAPKNIVKTRNNIPSVVNYGLDL